MVSAEQALNLVVQAHVQEFHAKFNECMKDPKFVEEWRCGGGGESFWRFSFQSNHNEATSHEIGLQLVQAGWKVREVNRVFDREYFTCYIVVKGGSRDNQHQSPVVAAAGRSVKSDAEKLKQACWMHLSNPVYERTKPLMSNILELIGPPADDWRGLLAQTLKFFEHFHPLAMEALAGLPE